MIIFFIHFFVGYEKILQMLVEKGANVNIVDANNNSALIFAASKGDISFIAMNSQI